MNNPMQKVEVVLTRDAWAYITDDVLLTLIEELEYTRDNSEEFFWSEDDALQLKRLSSLWHQIQMGLK